MIEFARRAGAFMYHSGSVSWSMILIVGLYKIQSLGETTAE